MKSWLVIYNWFAAHISEVEGMQVSCLSLIWETVCNTLSEYIEQTGGQINEGSRIEPHFPTTNKAVSYVFRLFNKTEQMQQVGLHASCFITEVTMFVCMCVWNMYVRYYYIVKYWYSITPIYHTPIYRKNSIYRNNFLY